MVTKKPRLELRRWKDCWVDLPAEGYLRGSKRGNDVSKRCFPDYHQIHVTIRAILLPGYGAVNESDLNLRSQRRQGRSDHVVNAEGLRDQALDFGKNRTVGIGLIQDLIALVSPQNEAHFGEMFELPLKRAIAGAGCPNELLEFSQRRSKPSPSPRHAPPANP